MSDDTANESADMFRVVFCPAFDFRVSDVFVVTTTSLDEARRMLNAVADYTLFLHDKKLMGDHSNFGGVEQLVDGEWEEVEDE